MRMITLRVLVAEYRQSTVSHKHAIVLKVWGSDGLDGIEALSWMTGVSVDRLAAIADIGSNVARAQARRDRLEHRRPRQPIPRGFRQEARALAEQAAHGRGFMPKRHWDPL